VRYRLSHGLVAHLAVVLNRSPNQQWNQSSKRVQVGWMVFTAHFGKGRRFSEFADTASI